MKFAGLPCCGAWQNCSTNFALGQAHASLASLAFSFDVSFEQEVSSSPSHVTQLPSASVVEQ